jgi:hypothetical protein
MITQGEERSSMQLMKLFFSSMETIYRMIFPMTFIALIESFSLKGHCEWSILQ